MNPQAPGSDEEARGGGTADQLRPLPRRLIGAVIAVAVVVAIVLWLVLKGGGASTTPSQNQAAGGGATSRSAAHRAVIVLSSQKLTSWASKLRNPIYWAGPQRGFQYEVTQSSRGWIYVGYVPPGEKVSA